MKMLGIIAEDKMFTGIELYAVKIASTIVFVALVVRITVHEVRSIFKHGGGKNRNQN